MTLGDAIRRYRREVTPKKSAARERKRIDVWLKDPLCNRSLASLWLGWGGPKTC